jgi:circadian clock protein KaiB
VKTKKSKDAKLSKPNRLRRIGDRRNPDWELQLYIAGPSPKSVVAFRNLEQICEDHLVGHYNIDVVDLLKNPQLARDNQIIAVPTVVRTKPLPVRRIIGDLSDTQRALTGLALRSFDPTPFAPRKDRKIF